MMTNGNTTIMVKSMPYQEKPMPQFEECMNALQNWLATYVLNNGFCLCALGCNSSPVGWNTISCQWSNGTVGVVKNIGSPTDIIIATAVPTATLLLLLFGH
jgi:hypothetical protein